MNKKSLIPFALISLVLAGCGGKGLQAPVLKVKSDNTGLVWDEVKGAASYEIKVNDGEPYAAEMYEFDRTKATYSVSVRALDESGKKVSKFSEPFNYETKDAVLGDLINTNGVITWSSFEGVMVEVKKDQGEYIPVTGNSYTVVEAGVYSFRAKEGFDATQNIFYVTSASADKNIVTSPVANAEYILEDGSDESNSELQTKYRTLKCQSNTWEEASTASITLSDANEGISDGKCVSLNYTKQGYYFRFDKDISLTGSYDTLEFYCKGDGICNAYIAFEVTEDKLIGSGTNVINMKGSYITYKIPTLPTVWTKYTVSLNDPTNWNIDYSGIKMTFAQLQEALKNYNLRIDSLGDLMPLFGSYQVRVAGSDGTYKSTKMYLDEVKLSNTGATVTDIYKVAVLNDGYNVKFGESGKGTLTVNSADKTKAVIRTNVGGADVEIPVDLKLEKDLLTVTSTVTGQDFVLTLRSEDGGMTFSYVSCTGTLASMLENASMTPQPSVVDDFESYEATGTGYDENHKALNGRTGLRAAYYSDFYSTSASQSQSPLGKGDWHLMGSTDYLQLSTDEHHSGSKSMKAKMSTWNAMRFISWGLYDATAQSIGKGTTFSFWAKGGSTQNIVLKVRVYTAQEVTAANVGSDSVLAEITIPANSDWTEYKVALANTTYYGFAMTTQHTNGSGSNDYFYIDDINVYTVSPWEA